MNAGFEKACSLTEGLGTRECHAFRERIFQAHDFMSVSLAHQYRRTTQKSGHAEANRELTRFHKRLTLGDSYRGLFIDSSDDEIRTFAEQKSDKAHSDFLKYSRKHGAKAASKLVIKRVEQCDLKFPLADDGYSEEELMAALARCFDGDWWRRQIKKRQDLILEHVHIQLGLVNKRSGIYASNQCVNRKIQQWQKNEDLLASLEAENDLGQVFNLLDLAKRGVSNLVNRRNELMTRISGFEELAKEAGDIGVFYTLTAPSKYHSHTAKPCKRNPKYEGYSPADTQDYLQGVWTRIRAKLHRQGITPYGFRVVEPHHDGTPHWHMLFFIKPEHESSLTNIIRDYALEECPNERGAQKSRLKVEHIDSSKGSAVGYIAKYIAKNIDGEHVGADHYGKDAIESAVRIRAWASNWNIRQFQAIGGPSVTVWREARKFATSDNADEILADIGCDKLQAIIDASDQGDWKSFVELCGGPTVARSDQPLRAHQVIREKSNKYGEAVQKLLGILYHGIEIKTKLREWTVRPITRASSVFTVAEGHAIGGANAPPLEFCQ